MGTDLNPTFLEIADAATPDPFLDGLSLMPLLKGDKRWSRDEIYWHFPAYLQGDRGARDNMRIRPCSAIRKGKYKLVQYFENGKLELYDLENDISETQNLSDSLSAKTNKLLALLNDWRKETNAPVPKKTNSKFEPNVLNQVDEKFGDELLIKDYTIRDE